MEWEVAASAGCCTAHEWSPVRGFVESGIPTDAMENVLLEGAVTGGVPSGTWARVSCIITCFSSWSCTEVINVLEYANGTKFLIPRFLLYFRAFCSSVRNTKYACQFCLRFLKSLFSSVWQMKLCTLTFWLKNSFTSDDERHFGNRKHIYTYNRKSFAFPSHIK